MLTTTQATPGLPASGGTTAPRVMLRDMGGVGAGGRFKSPCHAGEESGDSPVNPTIRVPPKMESVYAINIYRGQTVYQAMYEMNVEEEKTNRMPPRPLPRLGHRYVNKL